VSNVRNPFRPVKFEDEEHPLLYISELAKKQFVIGNFYFTGKRGCGKTTCLKIADTEFQLNDSVSNNKLYDEIANTTLGVYLNLNNRIIPNFVNMPRGQNKSISRSTEAQDQLTTEFLELTILRAILSSLSRLEQKGRITFSQDDERRICDTASKEYIIQEAVNIDQITLHIDQRLGKLIDASRGLGLALEFRSRMTLPFYPIVKVILDALRKQNNVSLIRILIDDGEVFDLPYQRALNTLVRTPEGIPVCWSIAYVLGKFDPKNTTINNQTLGREERTVVYLDNQEPKTYTQFAAEVIRLRVNRSVETKDDFNISQKLGSFNTNELAGASFEGTTRARALKFIERARLTARSEGVIPYYEQHLQERLPSLHPLSRDALRRKNVASYISLCQRYGLKPRYAGERVISALSDGCIRDYLEMMASIFDVTEKRDTINTEFLSEAVLPIDVQDEGCRDASARKLASIRDYTERSGLLLEKLVQFIGTLAHLIQTNQETSEPLQNPERAIFGIAVNDINRPNIQLIKDGEVDGYLRHIDTDKPYKKNLYCFRLHRQFVPRFNISYRESPDFIFEIQLYQFRQVLNVETTDAQAWAARVYREWQAKKSRGPSFFDGEDSDATE
jgi:hypothetical protein